MLAAETIEREVFPELKGHLNGIIDVNFAGFIKVVDTLGCAYVNVDHRYLGGGALGEDFSAINLQPGYQKLCYNNALSYVRFRHFDSDFVRVARQQDFLRDLREQISPSDVLGQIDTGRQSRRSRDPLELQADSGTTLIELAKLIAFSQTKPLRQVKFQTANVNAQFGRRLLRDLDRRNSRKRPSTNSCTATNRCAVASAGPPRTAPPSTTTAPRGSATLAGARSDLVPDDRRERSGQSGAERAVQGPLPDAADRRRQQQEVRAVLPAQPADNLHHAYVVVWQQNTLGGYYDFEGTDWTNPPLFAHARTRDDRRPRIHAGRRRRAHPRDRLEVRQASSTG